MTARTSLSSSVMDGPPDDGVEAACFGCVVSFAVEVGFGLITTIQDPTEASAVELAAAYTQRW